MSANKKKSAIIPFDYFLSVFVCYQNDCVFKVDFAGC